MSDTQVNVPLPTSLFLDLAAFLRESGSSRDPVHVVADAIDYWMENASWKREVLMPDTVTSKPAGFTWSYSGVSVFLPNGTKLKKDRRYHSPAVADVIDGAVVYNEQAMSPNEFASIASKGASINAWRALWVKRPHDEDWTLADELRARAKARLMPKSASDRPGQPGKSE
jgi:hypothetical protein